MKERNDKRTTVSLAHIVWDMAEEMMRKKGFNDNFSAYIADLVRRDMERHTPTGTMLNDSWLPYKIPAAKPAPEEVVELKRAKKPRK